MQCPSPSLPRDREVSVHHPEEGRGFVSGPRGRAPKSWGRAIRRFHPDLQPLLLVGRLFVRELHQDVPVFTGQCRDDTLNGPFVFQTR